MMSCEDERSFSLNEVLNEFMNIFEQCLGNDSEVESVPLRILIKRIASSIQIPYFTGTSCDLEALVRKILNNSDDINDDMYVLSRNDFIMKITEYINSLHDDKFKSHSNYSSVHFIDDSVNYTADTAEDGFNKSQNFEKETIKYLGDLIEDKQRLEGMCNNLQEQIKVIEKANTSLIIEKNALDLSFRDATKRESDWENTVIQMKNELKKSEEQNSYLKDKLTNEEEMLKREKEKCHELQRQLTLNEDHITNMMHKLTAANKENVLNSRSIDELEKKLESMSYQCTSVSESLKECQSCVLVLQEQLENAVKEKQAGEHELENNLHRLHLISLLHEDLEIENNLLKDKLLNNTATAIEECSVIMNLSQGHNDSDGDFIPESLLARIHYDDSPQARKQLHRDHNRHFEENFKDADDSTERALDKTSLTNCSLKQSFHKTLEEEIQEVEGKQNCRRVGCISYDSYSHSDVDPVLVEKIEKQQLVIKQLAETISKYSNDSMQCDSRDISDDSTPSSSAISSYSFEDYDDGRSGDDINEKNDVYAFLVSEPLLQDSSISMDFDNEITDCGETTDGEEGGMSGPVLKVSCDQVSNEEFTSSGLDDAVIGLNTSKQYHVDDWHLNHYDTTVGPYVNEGLIFEDKEVNECKVSGCRDDVLACSSQSSSSLESIVCNVSPLEIINNYTQFNQNLDLNNVNNQSEDSFHFMGDDVNILTSLQPFHNKKRNAVREDESKKVLTIRRPNWFSSLFICTVVTAFAFVIWSLIFNYGNTERQTYGVSRPPLCQPLSYYSIEELVQPYVGLRWHQPPPV